MTILDTPLGPFECYPTGTITRALQAGQWWQEDLKPILDAVEGGWAIDIGAHIGWFTIYLAQRVERMIALEPYPPSFQYLTANIQHRPGLEHRIQAWPVAAYSHPVLLDTDPRNDHSDEGSFTFTPQAAGAYLGMPVDDYLSETAPISLIKVDAQGADLRALLGLSRTLARCRPVILFEFEQAMSAWHGHTWAHYLTFFRELSYNVDRVSDRSWDYVARPA